jgi:hypothetical protein
MDNQIKKESVNESSCKYCLKLAQKSIDADLQHLIEVCTKKLEQEPKHLKALLLRASSYIKTNNFNLVF